MKYSVIIPTYNHCEDLLKPCIESIFKYTNLADIELIISANGCSDNTSQYLDGLRYKFNQLNLANNFKFVWSDSPLGYPKAINEGFKLATTNKIVLLNNDCILLEQNKNDWLKILEKPFYEQENCGITTVLKKYSEITKREFGIFFCVMIDKKVFDKIGLLNEDYGTGGCEDIEFCYEAENAGFKVCECVQKHWSEESKMFVSTFPIYHKAEGTMFDETLVPKWKEKFENNELYLANKYNREWYKWKLSNNYERAVFLKGDEVFPRESTRYKWAAKNILGTKVLEIGCSTGYGIQFLPENIEYIGIDYDERSIKVAENENWMPNIKFENADINTYNLEQYDTIIAFEVIEHLDNGLEIVEKLKKHCKRLLITVPYKETPGFWGEHHKLHMLDESHLPDFEYSFVGEHGDLLNEPTSRFNLMLCKYESKEKVLCSISTKNRYDTFLPLTIQSIINQKRLPDKLVIFDDNDEPIDLRTQPVYQYLFSVLEKKNVPWAVIYGAKKGQHHNHQIANTMGYKWVWRVDDDNTPEENVLENLLKHISDDVGAVGGAILTPSWNCLPRNVMGKIENVDVEESVQWGFIDSVKEVDHLHCSFLYRAGIVDYNLSLSKVAHREETLFTYQLKQRKYKILVVPNAITWHAKSVNGGIRSEDFKKLYEQDDEIFNLIVNNKTIVVLDCGMGDHIVFKKVLEDLNDPIVYTCYPEIIPGKSIFEAKSLYGNLDKFNIYKKMDEWNWKGSLENAYRKMYGLEK